MKTKKSVLDQIRSTGGRLACKTWQQYQATKRLLTKAMEDINEERIPLENGMSRRQIIIRTGTEILRVEYDCRA